MTTAFPTAIDAFTNPNGSDPRTGPDHAAQHSDKNDAIEALEAKVGVNGSAVATSLDKKVADLATADTTHAGAADPHTGYMLETLRAFRCDFSKAGALTTGAGTFRWYNDSGQTLTFREVRISAGTAPTGAAIIVDVNKNGTTIFTTQSNRPQIAISGNTGTTTTFNVTTIADGDYITIDIDQIGSTIAGSDLTAQVWMSLA
jgi:hypothetical protein